MMELARCEYIQRRDNVIAVGNRGTGQTHVALGLGPPARRACRWVSPPAAGLVHEMMEARDERRLLILQRQLARLNLLIIDELGFVPLSRTGAELLFDVPASAASGAPSWSPPTCPSTSGPRCSDFIKNIGADWKGAGYVLR